MSATQILPTGRLSPLVAGIRTAIDRHADWAETAQRVAGQLRLHLPTPDVLTPELRLGDLDEYVGHTLHVEPEELFDADLNPIGRNENHVGDVGGFAPPGDIHRVRNTGEETAISIHVYGTDVTRVGSSARRYYD
jgi:predicted metal-dependent enzyme (double-stranded beta helix superfamily)